MWISAASSARGSLPLHYSRLFLQRKAPAAGFRHFFTRNRFHAFRINIHTFVIHKSIKTHVPLLTEIEGSVII